MSQTEHFDLLVLGGGMAGISAATQAAEDGARVLVCEVSDHLGGTAVLSTGNVWTVETPEAFMAADPDGDVALWQAVRDDLYSSLVWLADLGVPVGERHRASSSSTYDPPPIGMNVDIETFMTRGKRTVEAGDGWVLYGTSVSRLLTEDGAVVGAQVRDKSSGEEMEVSTGGIVLATGGFQNNPNLLKRYLGPTVAESVRIRSNPFSEGAGLVLGLAAGAAASERMDTFYGVLLPALPEAISEGDFRGLVLHSAVYGLVLGPHGRRLADESAGAVPLANHVASVGRAALVVGPRMLQESQAKLGIDLLDAMHNGGARGARFLADATSAEIVAALEKWGYSGEEAGHTLAAYDATLANEGDPSPGRHRNRLMVGDSGLAVLEVQAAMTSTFGGIRTDVRGQALGANGKPMPGLFAAGIDQGGYNVSGYAGGLSRALIFGRRAAKQALKASS